MSRPDREATFLALIREHEAAIRRLAATYEREPDRRRDLVQDIWLAVWQALASFRGECSPRTFVFRVAHNRAVTHVKRAQLRRTDALDDREPMDHATIDPERAVARREERDALQRAVARLPLALRQATVLMLEGLNHREIAEVLGIAENTVAVRLGRARAALARDLAPEGAA